MRCVHTRGLFCAWTVGGSTKCTDCATGGLLKNVEELARNRLTTPFSVQWLRQGPHWETSIRNRFVIHNVHTDSEVLTASCSTGTGGKGRDTEQVVGESCCSYIARHDNDGLLDCDTVLAPDYQNTQCHIPYDRNIHIHCIEYKVF